MLCFFQGNAYASTGQVNITSSPPVVVTPNTAFNITGNYVLLTDTVPSNASRNCGPYSIAPARFLPKYWDWIFQSGEYATLHYSIDGVDRGQIGSIGYTRGINPTSDLGKTLNFSVPVSTSGMQLGSVHTASVFIQDTYGAGCVYAGWYTSWGRSIGPVIATATHQFTIADPTPNISIKLGKPSLTPCDAETGNITVTSNDPTPNGGTVTLTFPNGTTASAAFAGKTAILTFADFGLPNGYSGASKPGSALNFTASVTTAAGHTASATATANVITGGLAVTVAPTKVSIEPTVSNRYRKWIQAGLKKGVNQTSVSITVKNSNVVAVGGATVNLHVERASVKYGGHDHDASVVANSTRPLGVLSQVTGVTDASGAFTTIYTAPAFAAQDRIVANASLNGCTGSNVSSPISSERKGFQLLITTYPDILYGGTDHHTGPNQKNAPYSPDHTHWLSPKTTVTFKKLLALYKQKFKNKLGVSAGLRINDGALPLGGRFEAITQATQRNPRTGVLAGEWTGSHTTHSLGTDVDVGLTDTNGGNVYLNLLDLKEAYGNIFRRAELHPFPPRKPTHVHIYFNYGYTN